MNPDTYTTIIDEARLRLLMNTFLGKIEKDQDRPSLDYTIQPNIDTEKPTIIECCRHAKSAMGVSSSERYRCFSLESRLLAIYSTAFNSSCPKPYDKRYQITLQHLDNPLKKHTIFTNEDLEIQSIFLDGPYLIVGSNHGQYSDNKHTYRIDIYDAREFSNNANILTSANDNSSVSYFLGIDIEIDAQFSAETQENIKNKYAPCKLLTINNNCCVLEITQTTDDQSSDDIKHIRIPFLNVNKENINIDGYQITYRKQPIIESVKPNAAENKEAQNTVSQNWYHNKQLQIGVAGTALLIILLYYGYHNKKNYPFFNLSLN
jgi:hypothetical protein